VRVAIFRSQNNKAMKKIVIPYDFSTEAEYALDVAVQFSEKVASDLYIIHVIEVPSSYLSLYPEYGGLEVESVYSDDILKAVEHKLNQIVDRLKKKNVNISCGVVHGKPFENIQQTIISEDADLIIMGSKGATGLKEIFVGSNTERVIRYAKVPVLTIKRKTNLSEMSSMVFASDLSVDNSVKFVKEIQQMLGLKMELLKVFNTNEWTYTERTALEKIELFGLENGFTDYSVHVIDSPFVTDGILKFAHEKKADLIVMGTHGYKGIGHLIAGSNAEGVANHSEIPIFTIHKK
jgi:nucleotide-binding universal stress UspA family protein